MNKMLALLTIALASTFVTQSIAQCIGCSGNSNSNSRRFNTSGPYTIS